MPAFRPATAAFLAARRARDRKPLGQYFTPAAIRARLLGLLEIPRGACVLDPAAGTGELLLDVREREPSARLLGFEIDPDLVRIARDAHGLEGVEARDALGAEVSPVADLVVGNPPYVEVRATPALRARFGAVISGRPNLFACFVELGLDALRDGGRLAYVIPPSLNNGAYFEALRRRILDRAAIEHLVLLDGPGLFRGAEQSVMLLVLRKGARSEAHVVRADLGGPEPTPLFAPDADAVRAVLAGRDTLASLGFLVRTGRCVWNERRADLRDGPGPGAVPLVRATDIPADGDLVFGRSDARRPAFVAEAKPDVGPAVVVNRITGVVGAGALRAAVVPAGVPFVAENHVNVIRAGDPTRPHPALADVVAALRSPEAVRVVRLVTGNTQLSATELAHLVPIGPRQGAGPGARAGG